MKDRRGEIKKYTVITTVYNDENDVTTLLKEIENQDYQPNEVIVVDGGSNDGTVECVKEFSQNSSLNIRLIFGERLNIAQGLNRGIENAHNELIGIAMCGNHYKNDFFRILYQDMEREKDIFVSYGAIRGVSTYDWGRKYIEFTFGSEDNCYLEKFPTNHGNLARKELYKKVGLFYENFQYAGEDMEFFLRAINLGYKMYGDERAIIEWETPASVKQYYKQQAGYTISDMEMYSNRTILDIYWRNGGYVLAWILLIICFLLPKVKYFGVAIGIWLVYKNVKKWMRYGMTGCILLNLKNFVPVLAIIKNIRFLLKKNKIPNQLSAYY